MLLSELYTKLSYGELSNLAISDEGSGTIPEAKRPRIITHLNEALTRLHSRFVLKEGDLILEPVAEITDYRLSSKFAQSVGTAPVKYIKDLAEPFKDDALRILLVNDLLGNKLPLNDPEDVTSMFTPQPLVLQVPKPIPGQGLGVIYQARHVEIFIDDPLTTEIDLPFPLEGALTAYIAHLVYSGMNSQEATAKAGEHLQRYEMICAEAKTGDLVNETIAQSNTRFEQGGWL